MDDQPQPRRRYRSIVEVSASLAGVLSIVMLGLSFTWRARLDGYLFQGRLAGLLLLAMSMALLLPRRWPHRWVFRTCLAMVVLTAGVSLWTLVAYLWGDGLAWVQSGTSHPLPTLRLSVLTSLTILTLALAYIVGPARRGASWKRRQLSAVLAMLPIAIGSLVLLSYPEGLFILNGVQSTPMSVPSAVMGVLLGLATLITGGSEVWPLALFGSESSRPDGLGSRWLRWGPVRLFLGLTVGILMLGSLFLRNQVKGARRSAERELAATADSKAREISSWFGERKGDADQILGSSLLEAPLRRFLKGQEPDRAGIQEWMATLSQNYGYRKLTLFDATGRQRAAFPQEEPSGAMVRLRQPFEAALRASEVLVLDLHRGADGLDPHLSFWIPIGRSATPGQPAEGVMLLQVDPHAFLFPLIAASSRGSASSETLLVRREGAEAVCLSELRHRPGSALGLRMAIAGNAGNPMVRAALGQVGNAAGLDYRGVSVIAVVRQVPGTPWSMMTKVDEGEIFGPLRRWVWLAAAGILGLVVLLAMGMGLVIYQDNSRRILAQLAFERERKALLERFSTVFSTSPDAMSINRLEDGIYLDVNQGFTRITGFTPEELLGRSSVAKELNIWVRLEDRERLVATLKAQGEVVDLEAQFRMKDGHVITGLMTAKVLILDQEACIITATRDLTQRKQAEEERRLLEAQLHQIQKQESLGALAGGVAHDMNNVLGAILSLASTHRAQLEDPCDPLATSFETIISACLRGRGVVKSLLCFARKELETSQPVDLNALAREVLQLLSHTTLQRITLATSLQDGLWTVLGDASTLSHALMNLCVNAMDAMPAGGTLQVKTENLPDANVRLTVTDTGQGMAPETQEKAMEPFFTTKPMGKGTGLGLAMVFGTVKAHGGTVEIHSRLGEGTSVFLTFPASEATAGPPEAFAPASARGQAKRILLVDDDDLIRASVTPMLELLGHQVHTAEGGLEAMALLDGGLDIDLVILDLNMPGLNGAETLAGMLAQNPQQEVLLASGYSDGDLGALMMGRPTVNFIQKPFSIAELQERLGDR